MVKFEIHTIHNSENMVLQSLVGNVTDVCILVYKLADFAKV